ncbi:MAG: hypothetical protein WCF46_09065 [Nitrososphaeraceae archaeon]
MTFHTYTAGNKRTGLLITQLFLHLNGYDFSYPKDTSDYVLAIAANENKDIRKIAKWIKENCAKGINHQSADELVIKLADGRPMGTFSESGEWQPSGLQ